MVFDVSNPYFTLIKVAKLGHGIYRLRAGTESYSIIVHKGKYWQERQFILTNRYITPTNTKLGKLVIQSANLSPEGIMSILVKGSTSECRVHMILINFIPTNLDGYISALK